MTKVDPTRAGKSPLTARPAAAPKPAQEPAAAPPATPDTTVNIPPAIAELVKEIDERGRRLRDDPTGDALERYKDSLRRFFDAVVAYTSKVSSEATLGLTRKVFSTIARVDVALGELADAVLGRQQDVLKVRSLVDQIKGLIVDLYR